MKECAAGTGDLCGSTFLNGNFEDLVRSRIGKRLVQSGNLLIDFDTNLHRYENMKVAPRNRMMKSFEEDLKRSFSNSEDDDIFICPIGGLADDFDAGIEDGGFVVTREEMKGIFDPVIDQIVPLVQKQINTVEAQAHRGLRLSV